VPAFARVAHCGGIRLARHRPVLLEHIAQVIAQELRMGEALMGERARRLEAHDQQLLVV
jgi:hypothetical protein